MNEKDSQKGAELDGIPELMTAAVQTGFGDVRSVLEITEAMPVPRELHDEQILVKVHAASMNQIDWKMLNGNMLLFSKFAFPHVPGKDIAGIVVAVGNAVKRLHVGDEVYGNLGMKEGGYAEYARGDESLFALKPAKLSMTEAAAVPLTCVTTYQALFLKMKPALSSDSKILVLGGCTATGLYAIQFAKYHGAAVSATCSERNFSLLKRLGYALMFDKKKLSTKKNEIHIIDYNRTDFATELQGADYDVVYDCVGGKSNWDSARRVLRRKGQFITIAGDNPNATMSAASMILLAFRMVRRRLSTIFSSARQSYVFHMLSPGYEDLDILRSQYIENGAIRPVIDTVHSLREDGAEALYSMYERSRACKAQGKLVLKIV